MVEPGGDEIDTAASVLAVGLASPLLDRMIDALSPAECASKLLRAEAGLEWSLVPSAARERRTERERLAEGESGLLPLDRGAPFTLELGDYAVYEGADYSISAPRLGARSLLAAAFGRIRNDTENTIHKGDLKASWVVEFSDAKVLERKCGDWDVTADCELVPRLSSRRLWRPGEWRSFKVKLPGIETVYRDYEPSDAVLRVLLDVEDPLGFQFDEVLAEIALDWRMIDGVQSDAKLVVHTRHANLEKKPGGRRVVRVRKGDRLTATERRQRYYRVRTESGQEGWVYYEKVRRVRDEPEATAEDAKPSRRSGL